MKNPANKRLTINVKLLRQVRKAILRWPDNFNMAHWSGKENGGHGMAFNPATMKAPVCGSACCLAGWAVTLGTGKPLNRFRGDIERRAKRLLGLTDHQSYMLFFYKGDNGFLFQVTPQEAADAIDRFIANPLVEKL